MNMTTMRMYCPSLKENVEATITDGKQVASKGGSLRNILYGEFEGRKCLPKTVKADVFAQHGFKAESVIIHGEKEGRKTKPVAHKVGIEEKDGFVPNRINIPSTMNPPYTVETSSLKTGVFENHAENSEKMNLTMKELLVLILVNRDWEGNDWQTIDGLLNASFYHDDVDMTKMRGVLSSLVKKGVIMVREEYVNNEKYSLVSVNDKYTTGVDDYRKGSINWNMFDCKDEIVSDMGYEDFIEWASTIPESIVRGMATSKGAETFNAETFEAYEDQISERQEYKIASLGGKIDAPMNRSDASDYIKKLMGKKSGTWKDAESFEAEKRDGRDMTLDEIEETYGEGRLCFLCFDGVMERGEMGFGRDATGTIYTCSNCGAREGMGLNAETFEDCEVCYATVDKGTLNDVQAGRICNECHKMNQYEGGTKTIKTPYNAESSPSSFDISWEDAQGVSSPSLPPEGIHFAEQEGECEVCFAKNDGTGNLTRCNRCEKQICLGDMDACSSICGECETYCCDACLMSNENCANCDASYRAEQGKNIKFCNGCNKRTNFEDGECNFCAFPEFGAEGDYRMNGEGCEYCAETRELNAEGFCSECASHAESFSASSYEDAFFTETVSEMAAEGISRNGKLALSLTALGIGVAMALGSDTVSSLLDKITRK